MRPAFEEPCQEVQVGDVLDLDRLGTPMLALDDKVGCVPARGRERDKITREGTLVLYGT